MYLYAYLLIYIFIKEMALQLSPPDFEIEVKKLM